MSTFACFKAKEGERNVEGRRMKSRSKRVLSMVLALCMALALWPATAHAAEPDPDYFGTWESTSLGITSSLIITAEGIAVVQTGFIGNLNVSGTAYINNMTWTEISDGPDGYGAGYQLDGDVVYVTGYYADNMHYVVGGRVSDVMDTEFYLHPGKDRIVSILLEYERVTDNTAPKLSEDSVNRTSDTEATVVFTTDEVGVAYYIVQDSGAPEPSNTEVRAGTSLGGVNAFGTVSERSIDLTAGAKDVYIVVEDAAGNLSEPLKIEVPPYGVAPGDPVPVGPGPVDLPPADPLIPATGNDSSAAVWVILLMASSFVLLGTAVQKKRKGV